MSLGIVFKGPEGVVLAADSRVTLTSQVPTPGGPTLLIQSAFDNATKLLKVAGQEYVGAVTFGAGAIGSPEPRTAHSFLPEFEASLKAGSNGRLPVMEFAAKLSEFFLDQWNKHVPPGLSPEDMIFFVGGFDEGATYGRTCEIKIPSAPTPREIYGGIGEFGVVWGGQSEFVSRLLIGYDDGVMAAVKAAVPLDATQEADLKAKLDGLNAKIPYQFLPLQDSVNLAIFLIRTTIKLQTWQVGIRGVGGAIDLAIITKTDGFKALQQKSVRGEHLFPEILL
jgi:hypothetical protein